jgi:hypothetical protein
MLSAQSAVKQQATKGEHLLVQVALPGMPIENFGMLLIDSNSDRLYTRFRRDSETWAGNEVDLVEGLGEEIFERSQELGGRKCLEWMESTLSHTVQVSDRVGVFVDNYHQTIQQLYLKYIRPKVLPFRTHLPQLTLEAAAGKVGKQMQVEPEGWVEVWPDMILTKDMFIIHTKGYSMEPTIPDGSLCAISGNLAGTPDGKVVLVEDYGEYGGNRYTIKRYRVSMNADPHTDGDEAWLRERFTLESLNPDYKSWDVASAGTVRVLGEFLFVVG